ncbi:MAG: phosphoribosyltransferase family protein [bacterium]|nr:phosphoribosyltransferase family protein [bacterium]
MTDVIEILKRVGAILGDGHFVGTSGRHLRTYINKDALFPHTEETARIGQLLAEVNREYPIEVVVAPALGGIILSQWTAYHLSQLLGRKVLGVYTEKINDQQKFTRGHELFVAGKNVLALEDLTTTGGSLKKVIATVQEVGGKVVAASAMVNRDAQRVNAETLGVPFSSLGILPLESYEEKDCPMCALGLMINTQVGHGRKYLEKNSKK